MQPQTDAEMHAWNYGADWCSAAHAMGYGRSAGAPPIWPQPFGDAERAERTLGPDLFMTWAVRGYAAARATIQ
jgi:hypothetical protein